MLQTKTRRGQNREARYAAIVAMARVAFLEHGYAATSMSTIAAQLGGSKGTLWAYFPSKEDLFAAVLDDVTASFRQKLEDALLPGRDCYTTLLDFSERFLAKVLNPDSIRLYRLIVGEGGRFPEIGQIFYSRGPKFVLQRLSDYIGERMQAGDLRTDDPFEAATNLVHFAQVNNNLQIWGIAATVSDEDIRKFGKVAVSLFFRIYGPDTR